MFRTSYQSTAHSKERSTAGTNCLGDEEVLPDDQLFGAEPTSGGWGEPGAAEEGASINDAIQTENETDKDESSGLDDATTGLDVWQEATQLGEAPDDSSEVVLQGSEEVDEDAEWRQVARAEMLEEHYRGVHLFLFCSTVKVWMCLPANVHSPLG